MSAGAGRGQHGAAGEPQRLPEPRVVLRPVPHPLCYDVYEVLLDTMVVGQVQGSPPWFTEVRDVLAPITPDADELARQSKVLGRPDEGPRFTT